jgi:hypothetical protein
MTLANDIPLEKSKELFVIKDSMLYWRIKPNKSRDISKPITTVISELGYLGFVYNSKRYRAHRIMYQLYHEVELNPDQYVDHMDMNVTNNSIENLRSCNKSTNGMNRTKQSNNSSGYKGVTYHKGAGKYMAQLEHHKKRYYLGLYDTPELAYEAYCKSAKEIQGEFFHP